METTLRFTQKSSTSFGLLSRGGNLHRCLRCLSAQAFVLISINNSSAAASGERLSVGVTVTISVSTTKWDVLLIMLITAMHQQLWLLRVITAIYMD